MCARPNTASAPLSKPAATPTGFGKVRFHNFTCTSMGLFRTKLHIFAWLNSKWEQKTTNPPEEQGLLAAYKQGGFLYSNSTRQACALFPHQSPYEWQTWLITITIPKTTLRQLTKALWRQIRPPCKAGFPHIPLPQELQGQWIAWTDSVFDDKHYSLNRLEHHSKCPALVWQLRFSFCSP